MPDDVMMAMASALAGKIVDAVWRGAGETWEQAVRRIRGRLSRNPAASATLQRAAAAPESDEALKAVVALLRREAENDPDFAARLRTFQKIDHPGNSKVTNIVSGQAHRVIQAQDINVQGGLWMGDVRGSSRP